MSDASISYTNTSDEGSHITATLYNLSMTTQMYDEFSLELYIWWEPTSSWELYDHIDYGPGDWYGGYSIYHTFIDNAPNNYYYVAGWYKYGGSWYETDSAEAYVEIAQATSYISSTSPHSFTLYRYTAYGYLRTYIYNYLEGTYISLELFASDHGLSYSVSGNYITVYNWIPDGWVDILTDVYLKDSGGSYFPKYSEIYVGGTAGALNVPSSPTINHRLNVGFDMSWGTATGSSAFQCRYKTTGSYTETGYFYSNTNQHVWVDDQWGTTYYISVRSVYNPWNSSDYFSSWSTENAATTAPYLCYISAINEYNTHIEFTLAGLTGGWTRILVEWSTDTSYSNSQYITNPTTTIDITGLTIATEYNFRISVLMIVSGVTIPTIIWDGSGNAYDSITISTAGGRPLNWSWGTTVTAGGNTYGMDLANKKIKVLTAIEWNGFCTKVNQFRTYKVLSSVSFTSVAIGDDFLASYFNTVRTAINDMSPPTAVPSSVSAGDKITAAHINGLMTSLNSIL